MSDNQELQKPTIDLGLKRRGELDENALTAFGGQLGYALSKLLAGAQPFLNVKGNPAEIASLAATLGMEKRHLENIIKYGPNSPQAMSSLRQVDRIAHRFQDVTGIPWPFTS
jgi:hypothetical protein